MNPILIIDDQPEVLEMTGYVLRSEGFEVAEARDGQSGIEKARALRPSLILCDIMMPGVSGYEVLDEVRGDGALADVPFVFLTAKADQADVRTGMVLGADDYLTKPFSPEELVSTVKTRLEKHASINERFEERLKLLRQGLSTILPHELRTPLTLIMAHASFVLETHENLKKEDILNSVRDIRNSADRLHRLLENLLMYVELSGDRTLRIEHPEPINVARTAAEVASKLALTRDRLHDLQIRVREGVLHIHPIHFRKVVEELLENAFKFSERGTEVLFEAGSRGDEIVLRIADKGRGMSREDIARVEAYVQFDREHYEQQGGGLGLTIAMRIVELYGGHMEIDSEQERGTTVTVYLPVRKPVTPIHPS